MNNAEATAAEAATNTTTTTQSWNVDLSKLGIPPSPAAKPDNGDRRSPLASPPCVGSDLAVAVLDGSCAKGAVNSWVLAALCSDIDCTGGTYTTHKALRELTGYSESTIARALGCLARKGLVAWFRTPDGSEAHYIVNVIDIAMSIAFGRDTGKLAGDRAVCDAVTTAIHAKCADLSPTEKWVLVAVARYETTGYNPTQYGVARATQLKQSTVGKALASLERKGWVASCSVNEHRRGPRYIYKANMVRIKAEEEV